MGYRSKVVIGMTRKFYNEHKEQVTKLLEHSEVIDNIDKLYFVYDYIKWYSSYPEVANIIDFVSSNSDDICLLRLGEELGDVEEIGSCYEFDLYVNQDIVIPQVEYDTEAKKLLYSK